ncbi:hypothetical protein HDK77DRAFT_459384 [Phyllosticta capitalensis]
MKRVREYHNMVMGFEESFEDFQARVVAVEKSLGYWFNNPKVISERRFLDAWVMRLSPERRERLRLHTNSLANITREADLIECLRGLDAKKESESEHPSRSQDDQEGSGARGDHDLQGQDNQAQDGSNSGANGGSQNDHNSKQARRRSQTPVITKRQRIELQYGHSGRQRRPD